MAAEIAPAPVIGKDEQDVWLGLSVNDGDEG